MGVVTGTEAVTVRSRWRSEAEPGRDGSVSDHCRVLLVSTMDKNTLASAGSQDRYVIWKLWPEYRPVGGVKASLRSNTASVMSTETRRVGTVVAAPACRPMSAVNTKV